MPQWKMLSVCMKLELQWSFAAKGDGHFAPNAVSMPGIAVAPWLTVASCTSSITVNPARIWGGEKRLVAWAPRSRADVSGFGRVTRLSP